MTPPSPGELSGQPLSPVLLFQGIVSVHALLPPPQTPVLGLGDASFSLCCQEPCHGVAAPPGMFLPFFF